MKQLNFEPTATEVFSALGAAFIAIGSTLPPEHSRAIAERLSSIAQQMASDGDTKIATLCTGLAQSFAVTAQKEPQ